MYVRACVCVWCSVRIIRCSHVCDFFPVLSLFSLSLLSSLFSLCSMGLTPRSHVFDISTWSGVAEHCERVAIVDSKIEQRHCEWGARACECLSVCLSVCLCICV
jgi:hypothetical protein